MCPRLRCRRAHTTRQAARFAGECATAFLPCARLLQVLLTAGLADTLTDNMIQWIKERAAGPRPAATPGAGAAAGSEGETGATAKM